MSNDGANRKRRAEGAKKHKEWVALQHSSVGMLRDKMVEMYWEGVKREVVSLIRTLRDWNQEKFQGIRGEDEEVGIEDMQGFLTFVERAVGGTNKSRVMQSVRTTLQHMQRNEGQLSLEQRRAQMICQASGFLDITKLVEYRPPVEGITLWKTPTSPQLALAGYDETNHMPNFRPAVCSIPECSAVIRGTHFRRFDNARRTELDIMCETCTRKAVQESPMVTSSIRKYEKRCILREAVLPSRSRQICTCGAIHQVDVPHGDGFAVDGGRQHLQQCPIGQLISRHMQARLAEVRQEIEMVSHIQAIPQIETRLSMLRQQARRRIHRWRTRDSTFKQFAGSAVQKRPPNIPFGNVHMALMIGTVIIENGVERTQAGALISIRDPPQFTMANAASRCEDKFLCISGKRRLFEKLDEPLNRRFKACMKQVVGGVFTGFANETIELQIINKLVNKARRCAYDPMDSPAMDRRRLSHAAHDLTNSIQVYLGSRVQKYFEVFASKLFSIELTYNVITNNCQNFCANLLDFTSFGSFFATTTTCRLHVPRVPLYLLSFVCPPGCYDSPRPVRPESKRHAPNGLTEEYLLRFRHYGHHQESDIYDTLLQYWHDWGAFGSTLYRHQNLFPWDCTEAYRLGDGEGLPHSKCNRCNIARHTWAFPFDSFSITQLHLLRPRFLYASPRRSTRRTLTDGEWMHNRLSVLSALRTLSTIAVALALTPNFRATCIWNLERRRLMTEDGVNKAARAARIKLAGIHRAQPKSHNFEKHKYHDCELADWALRSRQDQQLQYEMVRDRRAEIETDVPPLSVEEQVRKQSAREHHRKRNEIREEVKNDQGLFNWFSNLGDRDKDQNDRTKNEAQEKGEDLDDWEYEDNMEVNYDELSLPLSDDLSEDISDDDASDRMCECEENDDEPNWNIDAFDSFDDCRDERSGVDNISDALTTSPTVLEYLGYSCDGDDTIPTNGVYSSSGDESQDTGLAATSSPTRDIQDEDVNSNSDRIGNEYVEVLDSDDFDPDPSLSIPSDVVGFPCDGSRTLAQDSIYIDNTNEQYWDEPFSTAPDAQGYVDVDIGGVPYDDFSLPEDSYFDTQVDVLADQEYSLYDNGDYDYNGHSYSSQDDYGSYDDSWF